jgi:primosomal protein N' (replication factor Y) (superfamily II helicase)
MALLDPVNPLVVVQVALDVPLRTLFDYVVPATISAEQLQPGMRVKVPFGRQKTLIGVVMGQKPPQVDMARLKPILEVIDTQPLLDAHGLNLVRFAAEYYHHPIGETVIAALPVALRAPKDAIQRERRLSLGPTAWPRRLGKVQKALLEHLQAHQEVSESALKALGQQAAQIIRAALKDGRLQQRWERVLPTPPSPPAAQTPPLLNAAQAKAVSAVSAKLGQFQGFLLDGITGSGKTEVYLAILDALQSQQRQALVLVPEISLTPQTLRRFESRFPGQLAVLHSGLSDGERLKQWRLAHSGQAAIVIGTRSAIFAPLTRLGAIIVDEEHDSSYKQQDGFRYSARDLALYHAQQLNIPVILGSATPALETLKLVADGKLQHLVLPQRAKANASLPSMALIDLRLHPKTAGLAPPTVQAIQKHLNLNQQVLIYLNRRGFAPTLFCANCANSIQCEHCDARLTVHLKIHKLRCHHCNASRPIPFACPRCQAELTPVGAGTERLEENLHDWFPGVGIARVDRDVITHAGELADAMTRINSGQAQLLVGTQMLTKGHDFPNVTLVVVVNADQGLFGTDFRASERLAQTITQVAGRAGRAEKPGEVLIQTACPEHPLLVKLLTEGYAGFAREALSERAQQQWPPYSRLVVMRSEAPNREDGMEFLRQIRAVCADLLPANVRLLGPAPAALERRAERYRAQLLLESPDRMSLQRLLHQVISRIDKLSKPREVRLSIDVDPLDLN